MANYITIDGGTTNTRISLIADNQIIDTLQYSVGAGKNMENRGILAETIKRGIAEILAKNKMKKEHVRAVLASGMLTSEYGICEIAHIEAPAGICELHRALKRMHIREITDLPIVLIPGVKTVGDNFENVDMMRGEETELMGILLEDTADCVCVLPGSHSKMIRVKDGKIIEFSTMLTGEMIAALAGHTILKDAIDIENANLDTDYLHMGFTYCKEHGIQKTAFKVRILKNMFARSADEVYSFFMGGILCGEIQEILKENPNRIVLGGKRQIKRAIYEILKQNSESEIICVADERAGNAAAVGMVKIFEYGEER